MRDRAFTMIAMGFNIYKTPSLDFVYKNFVNKIVAESQKDYERTLKGYGSDGRADIVGDDYMDINDNKYGNNVLLTSEAEWVPCKPG